MNSKLAPLAAIGTLSVVSVAWFWAEALLLQFPGSILHMIYSCAALPIAILICSYLIGKDEHWGRVRWALPFALGLALTLVMLLTYSLRNYLEYGNDPELILGCFAIGAVISLLGIALGRARLRMKQELGKGAPIAVFLVTWLLAIGLGWLGGSGAWAFFYSLVIQYGLLMIMIFACSLALGRDRRWDTRRWAVCLLLAFVYAWSYYFTFSLRNMLATSRFNAPNEVELHLFMMGLAISVVGMAIGCALRQKKAQ